MSDMKLKLKVWRQKNNQSKGSFEEHTVQASEHMSFAIDLREERSCSI